MTKKKTPGILFSIGYGDAPYKGSKRQPGSLDEPQDLFNIVLGLKAVLVDCRALAGPEHAPPAGSRKPLYVRDGFRRYQLADALGSRYRYAGHVLGGPGGGVPGPRPEGIHTLRTWYAAGHRLVLMCQESAPADCHRHHQISVRGSFWTPDLPEPLCHYGIDVAHIFDARKCTDEPKAARVVQVVNASALDAFIRGKTKSYDCTNLQEHLR
jgi:hypothetical protein